MAWNAGPSADAWGAGGNHTTTAPDAAWNGGENLDSNNFNMDTAAGPKDDFGGDGDGRDCYNCGETGHNRSECPNPAVFKGECRHCGKEGHMGKDCPTAPPVRCGNCRKHGHWIDECPEPLVCPRCQGSHRLRDCEEPVKCHHCGGEHMARECPDYVPTCNNCGETEHTASECKNARKIDRSHLPDMPGQEAWKLLEKAIVERDIDEVKEKIQIYLKAQPEITFLELEKAFRAQGYGLYLIPLHRASLSITLTNMDLQGNLGKKYTVNYRFSDKPRKQTEKEGWPKDHAEILARLEDAGDPVPCGKAKCSNCNELGHISKNCPQDRIEAERVTVMCYNCGLEGHRVRDCPTPRVDKFACKNCGKSGHRVAECTEPRSADDVECRKCNKMGHFSRDCPDAEASVCRNCRGEGHMAKECTEPRKIQCRNCDEYGHTGKECPKPRDMSRVKCQNCQEMGHFKSRCPNPPVPEDGGDADGGDAGGGDSGGGAGVDNWGAENPNAGGDTGGGGDAGGGDWKDTNASGW